MRPSTAKPGSAETRLVAPLAHSVHSPRSPASPPNRIRNDPPPGRPVDAPVQAPKESSAGAPIEGPPAEAASAPAPCCPAKPPIADPRGSWPLRKRATAAPRPALARGAVGGPSWKRPLTASTASATNALPNEPKAVPSASPRAASMSSSAIVPVASASPNSALTTSSRTTVKVSSASAIGSLETAMSMRSAVVPGAKTSAPLAAAKSSPARAEPSTVR